MNRATGVALLLAVLLAGYLFFFERGDRAEEAEGEPVFGTTAAEVAALSLERPGAPAVRLERAPAEQEAASGSGDGSGGGFTVREGEEAPAPADAAEVDLLLRNLESLRFERRLPDDAAADRTAFGLGEPELTVRVEGPSGAGGEPETVVARFGAETPAPGNRYLEVGEAVVIVPAWTKDHFDRSAWDFRDKRLFRFDTAGITELRLRAGDEEVVLERERGDWRIVRPFRFAADSYDAAQLAAKVREAEMIGPAPAATASAPEGDGGEDPFGLAEPRLTASFTVETPEPVETEPVETEATGTEPADSEVPASGVRSATIHFGGASDDPLGVFARVADEPAVFVVGQTLFDELSASVANGLAEVRSLRLFRFAAWKAVELRLAGPEGESVFRRRENGDGEREWTRETEAGAPTPADSEAVEDLLYRLNSTDAEEVVADAPGGAADLPGAFSTTITVTEERPADGVAGSGTPPTAGRMETVRFGTPEDGRATALREGDDRALRLSEEAMEEIRVLFAALGTPPPPPAETPGERPEPEPSPP